MTSSGTPDQNNPATRLSEDQIGSVLQRGGQALAIQKVPDQFTVQFSRPLETLPQAQLPINHIETIKPGLEAVEVAPHQLDKAMSQARESKAVTYASHVYRLEGNGGSQFYLTDQITVQFRPAVNETTRQSLTVAQGLKLLKPLDGVPNTFIYQVTEQAKENPIKISNRLAQRPEVVLAEPNITVRMQKYYRPKDTMYPKQWYLYHNGGGTQLAANSHIFAEPAWEITKGVRAIVVAITDDSVDLNHPDFQGIGKIVAPLDLKGQDRLPLPEAASDNHGTSCAGVAVAEENGTGIVGVAPGCALMPIRTTGYLDDESVEKIFDWAWQQGASVISCSWGASAVSFPLSVRQQAAVARAATKGRNGRGCVILFAAGNANRPVNSTLNEQGWPNNIVKGQVRWLAGFAAHPDVMAISASTSLSKKAAYSNWGAEISVCGPSNNAPPGMWFPETGYISTPPQIQQPLSGLGVFTADRVGAAGYDQGDFTPYFGGTSSATPVVAGVAALVLSVNPDLTAKEVRRILQQTADKIVDSAPDPQLGLQLGTYDSKGHSQWFGYGKVNAYEAVKLAQSELSSPQQVTRRVEQANRQPLSIPDNDSKGVSSSVTIAETSTIQDIQITVEIEHQYLGDIEVSLIEPQGQRILLQDRTLGRQTQLKQTYTLQSTPLLHQFLNLSPKGTWKLNVTDQAAYHTGQLKQWILNIGL
ncbi:MAG: S8 family serine peptidase [Oscillatoriales cyanobacterium RM2_1_1]|nr:S8 family serine peptidase [Oscillatoriales cyanobacterium SM2_3_0]NJO46041.1 S8 family serine peptidase [Oscillatoriales cyanobacterium RM2_1_1]